jgi:predicted DNA-binding protein with PD1-like motif
MFVEENRRTRRIVARLARGESVRDALESLARDRAVTTAWVTAHGVLARATLEARIPMRPDAGESRSVEGPFELVSLTGDLASRDGVMHLDAVVVLAKHTDHGLVTFGGHLVDAEAEGVTVMLDCLDDLGLRREVERPTGLEGWRSANATAVGNSPRVDSESERAVSRAARPVVSHAAPPAARPTPSSFARSADTTPPAATSASSATSATSATGGWAAAAAASASSNRTNDSSHVVDPIDDRGGKGASDEIMPVAGDWVDHRQFGLCRVDRALPDGELMIKLETGRRKEIRLDYLEVLPFRMDGTRRIFPLRPRKKD